MNALVPVIAVAAGGAIGAVLRFSVYKVVDSNFPWATFIVNIIGCMIASFLMFRYSFGADDIWRLFLFVGVFGAFTTMSTFTMETVNLVVTGEAVLAIFNVFLNAIVCTLGAFLGYFLSAL